MIDIEKLAIEAGFGEALLTWPNVPEKLLALCEAYAAKVLEDKEREIAELKDELVSYKKQVQYWKDFCEKVKKIDYNDYFLLQSHSNDLREALEKIAETNASTHGLTTTMVSFCIKTAKEALSKTPAQSLQAFENEVIEKCAKVCDENGIGSKFYADNIRALKVTNE